jgi:dTDP-4-amino-4,6-dideoxygalactose transaminase
VLAQVHYIPIHLQPFYRSRFGAKWGDLPVTEKSYLELLSLPLFPGLGEADQGRVIDVVHDAFERLAR